MGLERLANLETIGTETGESRDDWNRLVSLETTETDWRIQKPLKQTGESRDDWNKTDFRIQRRLKQRLANLEATGTETGEGRRVEQRLANLETIESCSNQATNERFGSNQSTRRI